MDPFLPPHLHHAATSSQPPFPGHSFADTLNNDMMRRELDAKFLQSTLARNSGASSMHPPPPPPSSFDQQLMMMNHFLRATGDVPPYPQLPLPPLPSLSAPKQPSKPANSGNNITPPQHTSPKSAKTGSSFSSTNPQQPASIAPFLCPPAPLPGSFARTGYPAPNMPPFLPPPLPHQKASSSSGTHQVHPIFGPIPNG